MKIEMTTNELIQIFERYYPIEKAESWDNPGLQVGRRSKEVKKIFIALDATDEIINQAKKWGADLLLTHHPLMISGIKKVNTDSMTGKKIVEMLQSDLCHYAMHTNYDVCEMAQVAGKLMKLQKTEILEITGTNEKTGEPEGFGRVGEVVRPVTLEEYAKIVKTVFKLDSVKVFGNLDQMIERAAISPGSGKSMIQSALKAKVQVLVTGDIGHHDGIDAVDQGLAIIDAGHYGLEHIFIDQMKAFLETHVKHVEVKTAEYQNPFQVI
ncbi:MAG: Nif3-like dinuclear metal center hexameric protein [Muricoprocola sp.]